MPRRIDEIPPYQHDGQRQDAGAAAEPRNLHLDPPEINTPRRGPHAGFDRDLNPIDDEFINTRGSER